MRAPQVCTQRNSREVSPRRRMFWRHSGSGARRDPEGNPDDCPGANLIALKLAVMISISCIMRMRGLPY